MTRKACPTEPPVPHSYIQNNGGASGGGTSQASVGCGLSPPAPQIRYGSLRLSARSIAGDREIVEASPEDKIWGIGLHESDARVHDKSQWQGPNWLGEAIMNVRETLKKVKIEM